MLALCVYSYKFSIIQGIGLLEIVVCLANMVMNKYDETAIQILTVNAIVILWCLNSLLVVG